MYEVVAVVKHLNKKFGPFETRKAAESCVIVLAARPDVSNAWIEDIEDT